MGVWQPTAAKSRDRLSRARTSHNHPEVPEHNVWREGPALRFFQKVIEPNKGATKDQLGLEDELEAFWLENARWGPLQRWKRGRTRCERRC